MKTTAYAWVGLNLLFNPGADAKHGLSPSSGNEGAAPLTGPRPDAEKLPQGLGKVTKPVSPANM